jgi:3,5-epimerase/4-reductase
MKRLKTCSEEQLLDFHDTTRLLVIGINNWIVGHFVKNIRELHPDWEIIPACSRAEDIELVEKEITELSINKVLCCLGKNEFKNSIDMENGTSKLFYNIRENLYAQIILADICKKHNVHLTILGTGSIFTYDSLHPVGDETKGFKESDDANNLVSSCNVVRGFTDSLLRRESLKGTVLNLRIQFPTSSKPHLRNFITKLTTPGRKIHSVPVSITILEDLIPIAIDMMNRNFSGTVNLVNPGLISHNEILTMYKEIVNSKMEWINVSLEETKNRHFNCLDTTLLCHMYPQVKESKIAIIDILKNMKEYL